MHFQGLTQATAGGPDPLFSEIHELAGMKGDADLQLLNGVYYENQYFDATALPYITRNGIQYANPDYRSNWHPFLQDGEFHEATIHYRNSRYEHVPMKLDIFHRQVVINPDPDDPMLMILLSNEFISEFWLGEAHFRKFYFKGSGYNYYQVVHEGTSIKCYREWYRIRYKSVDDGNQVKYRFSQRKSRDRIEIGGQMERFSNNRSFIQLFPESIQAGIKKYLKEGKIKVDRAETRTLEQVIQHIETLLAT